MNTILIIVVGYPLLLAAQVFLDRKFGWKLADAFGKKEHDCYRHLQFQGTIGAPGFGQAYECGKCQRAFWSSGGTIAAVPYDEMDEVPELGSADVI